MAAKRNSFIVSIEKRIFVNSNIGLGTSGSGLTRLNITGIQKLKKTLQPILFSNLITNEHWNFVPVVNVNCVITVFRLFDDV